MASPISREVVGKELRPISSDPPPRIRDRGLAGLLSAITFVFERMSIDGSVKLGEQLGRIWYRLRGPRTRRVREQLATALLEESPAQREEWAREVFVHLGRGLAELILMRGRHRTALLQRVEVTGLEHLEAAARQFPPGGALIVTAHLGNWELAVAKVAALGVPVSVVYRELRQPVLNRAILGLRVAGADPSDQAAIPELIPMGRAGIRVVRAFQAGRKVIVTLDQNARRQEGVFCTFFERPASTRYGPIALATQHGVPVVPVFIRRGPDGRTHRIQIQPALQLESGVSDDEEVLRRNVQRVTSVIENEIRACPGQWIWTHRRWRTQPVEVDRGAAVGRN